MLTVKRVEKALRRGEPGRWRDDDGLYLVVTGKGSGHWERRYSLNHQGHWMGLGGAKAFSLTEARARNRRISQLLADGIDPLAEKRAKRAAMKAADAKAMTFAEAARMYLAQHEKKWRSAIYAQQWVSSLAAYVMPILGPIDVAAIDTPMVLRVLEPIWSEKTETANRVRGRIESVLGWATVRGYRTGDNPARWRHHLDKVLPGRREIAKVEHYKALPYADVPALMAELVARRGIASLALAFTVLTAARSGEVLGARWDEIDLAAATWTIPAVRMKSGKEHRVPLAPAAIELLRGLYREDGNDFLFIGSHAGGRLSAMAMTRVLRRAGSDITPHGFRSSFRVWCAEQTNSPREVCEAALAHTIADKVEATYKRTTLFDKRRKLMEAWARFCTTPARAEGADVIAMRR